MRTPIAAALLLVAPALSYAGACPKHAFTPSDQVKLTGDSVLIVTHPSTRFDGRMASKVGMDHAVRVAKEKKIPVLYLQDDGDEREYFFDDCQPDHWLFSGGGEINIPVMPSHVYTVGGHWELCQNFTLNDVMMHWQRQPKADRTFTVYMDAVYMKASMSFEPSDPYYSDFQRFIGIVNYDRGGESFNNKISMIEAMGIIIQEDKQEDFLIRSLPRYDRTLPDYRVELKLNQRLARVLQKGKGPNPPVLTFEFKSTANEAMMPVRQF